MRPRAIKRLVAAFALALALAGLGSASVAIAGNFFVITVEQNGEDRFGPATATVRLGDAGFQWQWNGAGPTQREHNVRQDRRLFYSGAPTTEDSLNVSASAGSYHYHCEVHGSRSGGMDGRVRVRPASGPPADNGTFRVEWAIPATKRKGKAALRRWPGPSETGDQFDVRFRVGNGDWRTWKEDTSRFGARFGRRGGPVRVMPDERYQIQARSEISANPSRRSDWSPKLTVTT